ncbi:MAG: hypothetical protein C4536_13465 [Actinobacteria bacterium]|jgi:hypothetical protein|nr:MAG: hypothetical protein C4536_13465 [Actinomycetota bacterium]
MSEEKPCRESFPWWIVVLANLVSLAIYAFGAFIIYQVGWMWMTAYLLFILVLEIRLLKGSCVHCYYYGKTCAFGRGRLSSLLFSRGDPEGFSNRKATWRDLIPDILVSLIPVVTGLVILVRDFKWPVLAAMAGLLLLATVGNGAVRGSLACKYCKQRELGCPAERLFQKTEY